MGEEMNSKAKVICLLTGGPMHKISVCGKIYEFEMHRWCGPNILNRKGEPCKHQPPDFLRATSLWAQQGQRIENGLCRWDHEPKPIVEHIVGKHYWLRGHEAPVKGE